MDYPERAPNALSTLDCISWDASGEACASLEDGVPSRGGGGGGGDLPMLLELTGSLYQI